MLIFGVSCEVQGTLIIRDDLEQQKYAVQKQGLYENIPCNALCMEVDRCIPYF